MRFKVNRKSDIYTQKKPAQAGIIFFFYPYTATCVEWGLASPQAGRPAAIAAQASAARIAHPVFE